MTQSPPEKSRTPAVLIALIAAQTFCAVFFIGDVMIDFRELGSGFTVPQIHLYIEAIASLSLVAAIVFEVKYLMQLLRRKAHLENSLRIAGSAFHEVIEAEFEIWRLTPAEQDVATFLVKGLSTSEIADMRGSAEGTIKAHLNAIYRKSGTRSRSEMLSLLIDTLMGNTDSGTSGQPN